MKIAFLFVTLVLAVQSSFADTRLMGPRWIAEIGPSGDVAKILDLSFPDWVGAFWIGRIEKGLNAEWWRSIRWKEGRRSFQSVDQAPIRFALNELEHPREVEDPAAQEVLASLELRRTPSAGYDIVWAPASRASTGAKVMVDFSDPELGFREALSWDAIGKSLTKPRASAKTRSGLG